MGGKAAIFLLLSSIASEARIIPRYATVVEPAVASGSHYDFIIAGGGISGLTLADRLTEDPDVNVLVIEAGPLDNGEDAVYVPGDRNTTAYQWPNMDTVPQPQLDNQTLSLWYGKVVGGGSTVNSMVFLRSANTVNSRTSTDTWLTECTLNRGTIADFDGWQSLGITGWSWDDMLPYYIKSENFTRPDSNFAAAENITWDDAVRGSSGPVQYTYPNYIYPANSLWASALESVGIQRRLDPHTGINPGLVSLPFSIDARNKTWTRSSARRNHYDGAIVRSNYHLLTEQRVGKVVISDGKATGVEYLPSTGGASTTVYASKEVIVTAGALNTPQILMLSGIGPSSLLQSLGIPVVSDLPGVGQNLQDHYSVDIAYSWATSILPNSTTFSTNSTYQAEQLALYEAKQPSAFTISQHLPTSFGLVALKDFANGTAYESMISNIRAYDAASSLPLDVDPTVLAGYTAQRDVLIQQYENPDMAVGSLNWNTGSDGQIFYLKTLSRGNVVINSTNPLDYVVIDMRTATDPADFAFLSELLRKLRTVMAAPAMATLGPTELSPWGAEYQTDEEMAPAIRQTLSPSSGHMCCTAAMLPRNLGGVVDSEKKVYGVQGLRVADVSTLPIILSGPPTSTVYAASEKLADMIKKEYSLRGSST
ncbi:putative Glucose-methanol-choline oxidoreductase N-terminal domain-containing protein [Seiridium unicorne]|uniref:Glucose-methanol-choline oxidoreductase N-terminal domain-containing protein n=1 Tax=Seiridium unicorne TaxID=138068 RepID=A0ABR2UUK1_9PEZI